MKEIAKIEHRVITLKKNQALPVNIPYYGQTSMENVRSVLVRSQVKGFRGKDIFNDAVEWYEVPSIDANGNTFPLLYYTRTAPILPKIHRKGLYNYPLFPDCLYPVAIWNITTELLDNVDNKPFWKLVQATTPPDPAGNVEPLSFNGVSFSGFHFVVINNKYVPKETSQGTTDDGHWVVGKPVTGKWIIDKLTVLEEVEAKPLLYEQAIELELSENLAIAE